MKPSMTILAAGAALFAAPALAQLNVGGAADATVGATTGNIGNTVGEVTKPVGDVVDRADTTLNSTIGATKLTVAAREDVRAGAIITDMNGNSIGTVQSVQGDTAVIVDGGKLYNVPLSELYRNASDRASALVSKVPPVAVGASASAEADAAVEPR